MASRSIRRCEGGVWYEIRRHENGTWYVHWTEGRRSRRTSTRQKDLALAQAFFDEWLRAGAAPAAALTVTDVYGMKYDIAGRTRQAYAWAALEPTFGGRTVCSLRAEDDAAHVRRRRAVGAAPATIRFEIACLRAALAHAVKRRILSSTDLPVWDALPEDSAPRDRWLDRDEVRALFAAAEAGTSIHTWMTLAFHTLARRTAIAELRWRQIDLEARTVNYLPPGARQTKKRRPVVPLTETPLAVLLALPNRRPDALVCGRAGHPRWVNDEMARVSRLAGVEGVTPHVWRHTGATWMARDGIPLFTIARMLGDTLETTERNYAHHHPDHLRDAAAVLNLEGEAA